MSFKVRSLPKTRNFELESISGSVELGAEEQRKNFDMTLKLSKSAREKTIEEEILINANLDDQPYPIPVELGLFPLPEITITDSGLGDKGNNQVFLGPNIGYEKELFLSLENDSYAEISTVFFDPIENKNIVPILYGPILLKGKDGKVKFRVKFPVLIKDFEAETKVSLKLNDHARMSRSVPIKLRYFPESRIELETIRFTDKGLDIQFPVKKDEGLTLSVPMTAEAPEEFVIKQIKLDGEQVNPIILKNVEQTHQDIEVGLVQNKFPISVSEVKTVQLVFKNRGFGGRKKGKMKLLFTDFSKESAERIEEYRCDVNFFEPEPYPHCVALDFGTTNSCVSLLLPTKKEGNTWLVDETNVELLKVLPIDHVVAEGKNIPYDSCVLPSAYNPEEKYWYNQIGKPAMESKSCYREAKRKLIKSNGEINSEAWEAIDTIIGGVLKRAEGFLEDMGSELCKIQKALVTVPPAFYPKEIDAIRDSVKKALPEIKEVKILDEPLAALYYFLQKHKKNLSLDAIDYFLIYDFGGGTTDVSILKKESRLNGNIEYAPIRAGGNPRFGGMDLDMKLKEILGEVGSNIKDYDIEGLKCNLNKEEYWENFLKSVSESETQLPKDVEQRTVQAFNSYVKAEVKKILATELADHHIRNLTDQKSLYILLAGGSSNLDGFTKIVEDLVKEIITQASLKLTLLGAEMLPEPKKCVSMGAFWYQLHVDSGSSLRLISDHNVTAFEVLAWLPPGCDPIDPSKVVTFSEADGTENKYCVLIEKSSPLEEKFEWSIKQLGLRADNQVSLAIYTRLGVEKPERQPVVGQPLFGQDERFSVSINKNRQIEIVRISM